MNTLKNLIKIKSDTNKTEIVEYLKNQFKDKSQEILIFKNKENEDKSILIGLNCQLKDICPIVLSGHIDTVKPNLNLYNTSPYDLTEIDGKAYGVGTIDMKSFTAIILDNIEKIKKSQLPIVLALTTDEETNFICIKNVIEKFKELKIKPKFTIIGEPTNSEIQTVSNGCYEYKVEIKGKSCHSSQILKGINAINIAAKLITFIEENQKNYANLTSNCGLVLGGMAVNIVPDYTEIVFDIRSTDNEIVESFLKDVKNKIKELKESYIGAEIELIKSLEIFPLIDKNNNIIINIANSLGLKISKFAGGCEAGYYQKYSGDAILFGVGDIALAHKPNEYVVIDEYKKYEKTFIKLLNYLDEKLK